MRNMHDWQLVRATLSSFTLQLVALTHMARIQATVLLMLAASMNLALAQDPAEAVVDPQPVIATQESANDDAIRNRIENIFVAIEELKNVDVSVNQGVVRLTGTVSNEGQARQAQSLAIRIEGAVTVQDDLERTLDIDGNVKPMLETVKTTVKQWIAAGPLLLLALTVLLVISLLGGVIARWNALWNRVAPNPFLAEIISQATRIIFFVIGIVTALNLLGATALIGTILGSAGVIGLAIGFAVRDTMENYISSIMLSIRQPFRPNDHVVISDHEGIVVRLTSRATILMTLSGNHLRIPNSTVYKSVIKNYSTNPQRRFEFALGVDAADDPIAAIQVGLKALNELEFVLTDPPANAVILEVGDSNIILRYTAWIDQTQADYGSARSLSIRAVTRVLETNGFTLPEPIYRLRFDQGVAGTGMDPGNLAKVSGQTAVSSNQAQQTRAATSAMELDISPDTHLIEKADQERAATASEDLLDHSRPTE